MQHKSRKQCRFGRVLFVVARKPDFHVKNVPKGHRETTNRQQQGVGTLFLKANKPFDIIAAQMFRVICFTFSLIVKIMFEGNLFQTILKIANWLSPFFPLS
jgi:hypothetical protein